jgi:hypothetical protein
VPGNLDELAKECPLSSEQKTLVRSADKLGMREVTEPRMRELVTTRESGAYKVRLSDPMRLPQKAQLKTAFQQLSGVSRP